MKIDGYSKHTLTYTDTRLHIHPPTDSPPPPSHTHTLTHKIWERRVKVGFDRHTFYKTRDYNISRRGEGGGGEEKKRKKRMSAAKLKASVPKMFASFCIDLSKILYTKIAQSFLRPTTKRSRLIIYVNPVTEDSFPRIELTPPPIQLFFTDHRNITQATKCRPSKRTRVSHNHALRHSLPDNTVSFTRLAKAMYNSVSLGSYPWCQLQRAVTLRVRPRLLVWTALSWQPQR